MSLTTNLSFLIVALVALTAAEPGSGPDKYQTFMFNFARKLESDPKWRAEFEKSVAEEATFSNLNLKFNCDTIRKDDHVPTSVHKLRPQDINVIASLGDSITAGNGIDAWTAVGVLVEKRGESWSIGGDKSLYDGVHTVANVMRIFNPFIKGYSMDSGSESSSKAWLNQAVAGAKAEDVPGETDRLIHLMKTDARIDYYNDWKMITLLIGGNDLCDYCEDRMQHSPSMYGQHIRNALDKLHAEVPRVLVNLVPMADVSPVPSIKSGLLCTPLHWGLCNCARNDVTRQELRPIQLQYFQQLSALANSGRYDTREDFTVVLQPHLVDQDFPKDPKTGKYDPSYIAPDCFHPNRKAHQGLSYLLWNTMLTPVGAKPHSTDLDKLTQMIYKCPTKENPFIFTNLNSPKSELKSSTLHKILHKVPPVAQSKPAEPAH